MKLSAQVQVDEPGPDDPKQAEKWHCRLPGRQQLLQVVSLPISMIVESGVVHVKVFELVRVYERRMRTKTDTTAPTSN